MKQVLQHKGMTPRSIWMLSIIAVLTLGSQAGAAILEVSLPVQVTDSSFYERGQSLVFDGSEYWLCYGRSASEQGWYQSGNPDLNDYVVYYKRAFSVADLTTAVATQIPGASNANSCLGETGSALFGGEVWAFTAVENAGAADLVGWYFDGSSWTEVAGLVTGLPDNAAHHDEIAFNGELFVVVNRGDDFYTTHTATPKTGGWSGEVAVGSAGGQGRFFVDGTELYLSVLKTPDPSENQIFQYDSDTDSWALVASTASAAGEPALFQVGADYVLAHAPSTTDGGGGRYLMQWSSNILDSGFFSGSPAMVSEGRHGANTWTDMRPTGFTAQGGVSYLFFTSERDLPDQEGTGNIWYLEVNWDLAGDHHTYIQEAVTAASEGDAIDIQAGHFVEQVQVSTANLSLSGAGLDATFIDAPASLPLSFPALGSNNFPVVWVDGVTGIQLSDLTVDGLGQGNGNYRFSGIAYYNSGGSVSNIRVTNISETPLSNADHGYGILCYQELVAPVSIALDNVVCDGFQWEGIACGGNDLTVTIDGAQVTGAGATDVIPQIGIDLFAGVTASVTDCSVTDIEFTGPTWVASGVRVYASANALVTGGNISSCQSGLSLVDVSVDLVQTQFSTCTEDAVYCLSSSGTKNLPQSASARLYGAITYSAGAKAPATLSLTDCVLTGTDSANSYGVWAQSQGLVTLDMTGCRISHWDQGFQLDEAAGTITGAAHTNLIADNVTHGGWSNTAVSYDATGNWWGDVTGPQHPTTNPAGLGNPVSDHILYDPFTTGNVVFLPDPLNLSLADDLGGGVYGGEVVCRYLGGGSGPVYGYSIDVTWDPAVVAADAGDFSRPDTGPFTGATFFFVQNVTNGVRIDAALGGPAPGTTADDLFKATLSAAGVLPYGASDLTLVLNDVRDPNNQSLSGFLPDAGQVVVDLEAPVVTGVTIVNQSLGHTDDYVKDGDDLVVTATVTDAHPDFGIGDIVADLSGCGGSTTAGPDSYDGVTATWNLPAVACSPADGLITLLVDAADALGNQSSASDDIIADNTAPTPLTGLQALPGHRKVDLSWDDPTGNDTHFDGVIIRYNAWGDYPVYATPAPDYPADPFVGDGEAFDGTGTGGEHNFVTDDRDIYYYSGFVYDVARNYSDVEGSGGHQARATNYWLGDVSDGVYGQYDGLIDVADISVLGSTYLLCSGDTGYKDESDIGPTHDSSRIGIPEPDLCVEFEDLMIMAMNFALVTPLKSPPSGTALPVLAWTQLDEVTWSLDLVEPCADFKGLRLTGELPEGASLTVKPGRLVEEQDALVFLRNAGPQTFDTSLAIMGNGVGFTGSGSLCQVVLSAPGALTGLKTDARSLTNETFAVEIEGTQADELPVTFQLSQNYPNPFNPLTRITFSLPEAQPVRLMIFTLAGKRVATLVEDNYPAGQHEVVWNGRDHHGRPVASGTYFYRIDAGPYQRTMKMILMK